MAGYAAMRDAAAKFLTQFNTLEVAKPLLASQPLKPKTAPAPGSTEVEVVCADVAIEAVPINDPPVVQTQTPRYSFFSGGFSGSVAGGSAAGGSAFPEDDAGESGDVPLIITRSRNTTF